MFRRNFCAYGTLQMGAIQPKSTEKSRRNSESLTGHESIHGRVNQIGQALELTTVGLENPA